MQEFLNRTQKYQLHIRCTKVLGSIYPCKLKDIMYREFLTYDLPHGLHQPTERISGNVSVVKVAESVLQLTTDCRFNKCHVHSELINFTMYQHQG